MANIQDADTYNYEKCKGGSVIHTIYEYDYKKGELMQRNIVGASMKDIIKTVKERIATAIKQGRVVSWNRDTEAEVTLYKEIEYSMSDDIESSEFIMTRMVTVTGIDDNRKIVIHHETKRRNPKYTSNPECDMCDKQVIQVYDDTRIKSKKPFKVCLKCKKQNTKMREIYTTMKTA